MKKILAVAARLDILGRVKVDLANNDADAEHRMLQTARFGVYGKTAVTDGISVFGKLLYDLSAQDDKAEDRINIRYGFAGFDFGDYGTLAFGRFEDAYYKSTAPTDLFLNWGDGGVSYWKLSPNDYGGRLDGQVLYDVNYQGYFLALSYQFRDLSKQIDHSYGGTFGYEFENVWGKPLGLMAGFNRYSGYESNNKYGYREDGYFYGADKHEWALSAYWGSYGAPGMYMALAYTTPQTDWTFMATYGYLHNEEKKLSRNDKSVLSSKLGGEIIYNLTANFQIYTELERRYESVFVDESENAALLGLIYNF